MTRIVIEYGAPFMTRITAITLNPILSIITMINGIINKAGRSVLPRTLNGSDFTLISSDCDAYSAIIAIVVWLAIIRMSSVHPRYDGINNIPTLILPLDLGNDLLIFIKKMTR